MGITTKHTLAAAYVGDADVKVTLSFLGHRDGKRKLALAGTQVRYVVTDGAHTVSGEDMYAPLGFRAEPRDLLRALCSFLANDIEHADAHSRGLWGLPCPEYGDHCPGLRDLSDLEAMVSTIEQGSWEPGT